MSEDSMDIDSELDFEIVEFLMKRKKPWKLD
jgi:CMP-N-acetylneuraminic acid synthetase